MTTGPPLRWGRPPLALVPEVLAPRLADVPLPEWLAALIDQGDGSAASLTARVWDCIPTDDDTLHSIGRHVLDLVSAHSDGLRDVAVTAGRAATVDGLVARWPTRARNGLLNSLGGSSKIETLTFGALLDTPHVGIKTALEITALLEVQVDGNLTPNPGDQASSPVVAPNSVPRWGMAGSALLPRTLRRAFADEALPSWLLRDLHLPADAGALALGASVWRDLQQLPERVERYIIGLVTHRATHIRDLAVIEGAWPPDLSPPDVPWPTRVHTSLARAQLLTPDVLQHVTYGTLLDIPGMGVKTILEFATIADTLTAQPSTTPIFDEDARRILTTAADEAWAERISTNDPRFRTIAPPYAGTLQELFEDTMDDPHTSVSRVTLQALPAIRDRAAEIGSEPIDVGIGRLLRGLGTSERDLAIVVARFGWGGELPKTLQEVGDEFCLSRERVRQIVNRIVKRVRPSYLPQIEAAGQVLEAQAPLAVADATELLVEEGLSTVRIHPRALLTAAQLLGYELSIHLYEADGQELVVAHDVEASKSLLSIARRQVARVGVSNTEEIQADLEAEGESYEIDDVHDILRSSTSVDFLVDGWFWITDLPVARNRLRNISRRMLAATPRLRIPALRQGIRRHYRFRQIDTVPPSAVLSAFYAAHPEFRLHDDDSVESVEPIDYREELGDTEQIFVEVLRASPTGLMDRSALKDAATARGMNPHTFSVYTTYSPVLDHPALNIWSLRGHSVDAAQVEALRAVLATRTYRRRTLAYGWDDNGRLTLTVELSDVDSPVITVPSAISRYVAGRRFHARTRDGKPAGHIVVDSRGTSWGYGPFLRRRGAERGDALTIRFDLASEVLELSLDDDRLLDDLE